MSTQNDFVRKRYLTFTIAYLFLAFTVTFSLSFLTFLGLMFGLSVALKFDHEFWMGLLFLMWPLAGVFGIIGLWWRVQLYAFPPSIKRLLMVHRLILTGALAAALLGIFFTYRNSFDSGALVLGLCAFLLALMATCLVYFERKLLL